MRVADRTATNISELVLLLDDNGVPIVDVPFSSPQLSIQYKTATDSTWQTITLVAGSASTWISGGWIHLGEGIYNLGIPNEAIRPGGRINIRAKYDTNFAQFDAIDFIGGVEPGGVVVNMTESYLQSILAEPGVSEAYRGTDWVVTLEGYAGELTGLTAVYFGMKDEDVPDDDALVQVCAPLNGSSAPSGLIRLNKAVPPNASWGEITHETYTENDVEYNRFVCRIKGEATASVPTTVKLMNQRENIFPTQRSLPSNYTEWKLVGEREIVIGRGLVAVHADVNRVTEAV